MDTAAVRSAIEAALVAQGYDARVAKDVAFHMTDWASDFIGFREFADVPDSLTPEAIEDLVMAFLIHVPNHLAAASKLMLDVPVNDVFGVGATEESSDDDVAT